MGMVNLVSIGCHTGSDDMDVVIVCVVVSIDQQRLAFLGISHLFEITVCNIEKLLVGVLCSLAADSHMELGVLNVCVPCGNIMLLDFQIVTG